MTNLDTDTTTRTRQPAPGVTTHPPAAGTPGTTSPGVTTTPTPEQAPGTTTTLPPTKAWVGVVQDHPTSLTRGELEAQVVMWRTLSRKWEQRAKSSMAKLQRIDDVLMDRVRR